MRSSLHITAVILILISASVLVVSCGESPSEPVRVNDLDPENPFNGGDPFNLTVSVGPHGVDLKWSRVTGGRVSGYRVKRRVGTLGSFHDLASTPDSTTVFVDRDIVHGNTYSYMVSVLDPLGQESSTSHLEAVTIHTPGTFLINGGDSFSNSREVNLFLSAADYDSAWVWNDDDMDGGRWLFNPQPVDLSPWTLAGPEGRIVVWARVHYATGQTALVSDSIVLDLTPPDMLGVWPSPPKGAERVSLPVPLSWSPAVDNMSGIAEYRAVLFSSSGQADSLQTGADPHCPPQYLPSFSTFTWNVVAVDSAGNEANSGEWVFSTALVGLVKVEAGTFMMGSPANELGRKNDEVLHEVILTKDFLISPIEVTSGLFDMVMGHGGSLSRKPKVDVTWEDALEFCNALSVMQGLTPVYDSLPPKTFTWSPDANGFRLPTEAEWELACRAGTQSAFSNGGISALYCDDPTLDEIGRYCGNSQDRSWDVGSLAPSALGIHDMHGNVWEWCWDNYSHYVAGPVEDPLEGGYEKFWPYSVVVRGGSFTRGAKICRSANRNHYYWREGHPTIGFRVARNAP